MVTTVFIVSWLVWQLALPLSYYFSEDVSDERFSWRMFSGLWLLHKTCRASVTESLVLSGAEGARSVRPLDLARTLYVSWVGALGWQRPLMEKFLRTRCRHDPSVVEVELSRTCPAADPSRLPSATLRMDCRAGTLSRSRVTP